MNLHKVARKAITAVNPDVIARISFYEGYQVDEGGEQLSLYSEPVAVKLQMQPATSETLKHIDGYNAGSVYKEFWGNEDIQSISRLRNKGGDKIEVNGEVYLTVSLPEEWTPTAGWVHVVGVLQEDRP